MKKKPRYTFNSINLRIAKEKKKDMRKRIPIKTIKRRSKKISLSIRIKFIIGDSEWLTCFENSDIMDDNHCLF